MGYFGDGGKRAIWVVHRRGGKDLTSLHQTCIQMHERVGSYWHVYPTAEQGKKAVWEGFRRDGKRIMENVFPSAIRKSPREWRPSGEMVVELKCGSIWRLLGSDRVEVVGSGPVGVVFSEYAVAKPSAWNYIAPMLDENDGWASFITTPRGHNHAHQLYGSALRDPAWFAETQTLYDTRAYDPEATIAAARTRGMPEALIRQEYLCDWTAANVGAVWGDLLEAVEKAGGIAAFEHDCDRVFTSWDLGIDDSTVIWWWRLHDGGVELLDYYESHGKPMEHYFQELDKRYRAGWRYERHFLPHDGRARSLQTGVSILDQFAEQCRAGRFGRSGVTIGPSLGLVDGIQAARWLLQQKIRLHARCSDGLEALRQYHYEYDEDRKTYSARPQHDWTSHGADGFRYMAVTVRVLQLIRAGEEPEQPKKTNELGLPTMDEMWESHESSRYQ